MNEMNVSRGLGWFSIGLGIAEVVAGKQIGRALGMENQAWLFRVFGVREIGGGRRHTQHGESQRGGLGACCG